jgi:hypothetical protein
VRDKNIEFIGMDILTPDKLTFYPNLFTGKKHNHFIEKVTNSDGYGASELDSKKNRILTKYELNNHTLGFREATTEEVPRQKYGKFPYVDAYGVQQFGCRICNCLAIYGNPRSLCSRHVHLVTILSATSSDKDCKLGI